MAALTGPRQSTQHDGVVQIEVDVTGPYGIHLGECPGGCSAQITSWERLPNGKFGIIQRHGGVKIGDLVVRVNDVDCSITPFLQTITAVQDNNVIRKVITFASPLAYRDIMSRKRLASPGAFVSGGNRLNHVGGTRFGFVSSVRQARINKENMRNPFAEYEIVCKMILATSKVEKDSTLRWSTWRRFSAFEQLDKDLRSSLGWRIKKIKFPPKNNWNLNKLNIGFVEKRRRALDDYYQQVLCIENVADFTKHHANAALKKFLDVDEKFSSAYKTSSQGMNSYGNVGEYDELCGGEDSSKGSTSSDQGSTIRRQRASTTRGQQSVSKRRYTRSLRNSAADASLRSVNTSRSPPTSQTSAVTTASSVNSIPKEISINTLTNDTCLTPQTIKSQSDSQIKVPLKDDPRYKKYFMMLRMHVGDFHFLFYICVFF